jgi:hypothetical protein
MLFGKGESSVGNPIVILPLKFLSNDSLIEKVYVELALIVGFDKESSK